MTGQWLVPLPQEALSIKLPSSDDISSDIEAVEAILKAFPGYLRREGKDVRVFCKNTGLWITGPIGFQALCAQALRKRSWRYGTMHAGMMAAFNVAPAVLKDDTLFFQEARERTVGKLLFTDGIWDKQAPNTGGKGCRIDFTPELFFAACCPHPIPREKPPNTAEMQLFMWDEPFPENADPGVARWLKQKQTRSIFGIPRMGTQEFVLEEGGGKNGKSMRALMFVKTFNTILVPTIQGKDMAVPKFNNPGAPSAHGILLKCARMVFILDPPKDVVLDVSLIKNATGGDPIGVRGLREGILPFITQSSFHTCSNYPVKLSECEATFMERRLRKVDSHTQYVYGLSEDDPENQMFKADLDKVTRMHSSPAALIWLLINEPLWTEAEIVSKLPESVQKASKDAISAQDEFRKAFDEAFERDARGKTASADIIETLQQVCPDRTLDPRIVKAKMVSWGFKAPRAMRIAGEAKTTNGYEGVKRKRAVFAVPSSELDAVE